MLGRVKCVVRTSSRRLSALRFALALAVLLCPSAADGLHEPEGRSHTAVAASSAPPGSAALVPSTVDAPNHRVTSLSRSPSALHATTHDHTCERSSTVSGLAGGWPAPPPAAAGGCPRPDATSVAAAASVMAGRALLLLCCVSRT